MNRQLVILIWLLFANLFIYSQDLEKGLKSLEKANLKKAEKIFIDIKSQNDNNAVANYGLAIIYSHNEYESPDFFKALELILLAEKNYDKLKPEEISEITPYINRDSVTIAKEIIDNKLFKYIKKQNRMDLIFQYIEKFPDAPGFVDVVEYRNDLEFRDAQLQNTVDAYNLFIAKYPKASQVKEARQLRAEILYAEVQRKNTLEAFDEFVRKYPEYKNISLAKEIRDRMAYKKASIGNNLESYEKFIAEYPDAAQIEEAKANRDALAFDRAKAYNTVANFKEYVKKYPNSLHTQEAENLALELAYKEALESHSLDAYNAFIRENPGNFYVGEIQNLKSVELGEHFSQQLESKDNINWVKGFDNSGKRDKPSIVAVNTNNEVYLAGNSNKSDNWYKDIWLIKTNSDGSYIWEKTLGDQYDDQVNYLTFNNQSELILTGHKNSQGAKSGKMWLLKISPDGNLILDVTLEGTDAVCHVVDDQDNIVVAGYRNLEDGNREILLYKIDGQGSKIWDKTYSDRGIAIAIAYNNSKYYLVSSKGLMVLGDDGEIINETAFQEDDKISAIETTPYGDVIMTGMYFNFRNKTKSDLLLLKAGPEGDIKWRKVFDKNGSYETATDIMVTPEGNILVASLVSTNNDTNDNIWLLEFSGDGNKIKETNIGGPMHEKKLTMARLSGSGLILFTSFGLESDYLLLNIRN